MHSEIISARGGCERCSVMWGGKNALAQAARHHDKTKHPTWAETVQRTEYGGRGGAARKSDQPRMI
jgi:hypothetical protein